MRIALVVCLFVATVSAAPLETYRANGFDVSVPTGWKVSSDARQGTLLARRDDHTMLMVLVKQGTSSTADGLLDAVAAQAGPQLVVGQRGSLPGGRGRFLVGDASNRSVKLRLGAVAFVNRGSSLVALLVANTGEYDTLGGLDLVTAIVASMHASGSVPAEARPSACHAIQRDSPAGTTCTTSTGTQLRRYQDPRSKAMGWQDLGNGGKVWFDPVTPRLTQIDAYRACDRLGQTLPTRGDFEVAEARGFREIVWRDDPETIEGLDRWTSTVDPKSSSRAYVFHARDAAHGHKAGTFEADAREQVRASIGTSCVR